MEYLSNKSSVARMDKNLEKISPFKYKNSVVLFNFLSFKR